MTLLDEPQFIEDLKSDLSGAEIARKWGCAESTARQHRLNITAKDGLSLRDKVQRGKDAAETFDQNDRGDITMTKRSDRIIPLSEWLADLERDGFNPDDFTHSHGHSIWQQGTREDGDKTLYANRFSATRKTGRDSEYDAETILDRVRDAIEGFVPPVVESRNPGNAALVICAADWQIGKTDINGGSQDTAEQILTSFARAADNASRFAPEEIVIIDAGDIVENLWNVPSQRATNDLGLPHQVEAAVRLMVAGIKMLAPLAPRIRYVAVPSNHGRSRVGYKAEAGDAHDDYGIAIAKIVRTALSLNDAFAHVEIVLPEPHLESIAIETCGSKIGVVHGHQASRPDGLADWWRGQALGNGPVADARILIAGHFHSLRMQTVGDDRTLFVCPSSDRGSSWYTNLKGESSRSGMLTFLTVDNEWGALEVL
jgi:hypothetical protein